MKIAFIHPNLGIGGAERLIIDAGVALQEYGHQVAIFTSYCDRSHCFEEARDGTLNVKVAGSWLPQTLAGRFWIFYATLRQLWLCIVFLQDFRTYDAIFVDQLSACIPILRFFSSARILFYCHFPDQLLVRKRNVIRNIYRAPFNTAEFFSTELADKIAVNSKFTAEIYKKQFPASKAVLRVIYPSVPPVEPPREIDNITRFFRGQNIALSVNRFSDNKNVALAIESFALLRDEPFFGQAILVIAGGYDPVISENAKNLKRLEQTCKKLDLKFQTYLPGTNYNDQLIDEDTRVCFLLSINSQIRLSLYSKARIVLYTPANEHFGIVPLEAMQQGTPVLAQNNGGPLESIIEGRTGWLSEPTPQKWAGVLKTCLGPDGGAILKKMEPECRINVAKRFSRANFALEIQYLLSEMMHEKRGSAATLLIGLIYRAVRFNPMISALCVAILFSMIGPLLVSCRNINSVRNVGSNTVNRSVNSVTENLLTGGQ